MKSDKPIREEILLWIFAWSVIVVILVVPRVFSLSVNTSCQYLAYLAGFFLAVDFLGKERVDKADAILTTNAAYISRKFTDFLLYYYLIKVDDPKDKREVGTWYVFCVLDTTLILVLSVYTLPRFGINVGQWLAANLTHRRIWLGSLLLVCLPMIAVFLSRFVDSVLARLFRRKVKTGFVLVKIISIPGFLVGGLITLPWLVFVGITWLVLQVLLLAVRLKARFRLGNVFIVLGFLFLFSSFLLFVLDQIGTKGS